MKAVDTNVLVRFLVKDDERQAQLAYAAIKQVEANKETLFVPLLVVLETIWVLQSVYGVNDDDIITTLSHLLDMPVLQFEQHTAIQQSLAAARAQCFGLADLLIAHSAKSNQCESVLTFDKKAAGYKLFELLV